MSKAGAADAVQALPCAACKQLVIEKRSLDGAVVVLDAATKRLHLCLKRKEAEAVKAKQMAASRPRPVPPPKVRPPVKRPVPTRETKPVAATAGVARKHGKPRKQTLRSPAQVQKILESKIVRWRTPDGPTSFCDTCGAPVLVGFSHVRWDVIMVDAAGHRPHDCETSRRESAALRAGPASRVDVPELPAVEPSRRAVRALAPTAAAVEPIVVAKPRRRAREQSARVADNSCETCGNLKAVVNGAWVCLHCGA